MHARFEHSNIDLEDGGRSCTSRHSVITQNTHQSPG